MTEIEGTEEFVAWLNEHMPDVAFTKVAGKPKVTIKAVHIERIEDNT